ncbi:hypothetical protein MSAN_01807900 [Mycena sanguinolenta]|uniref:Ricin B lectin domain-containing protein n=1 Tax=Mycena sanguinolenta TaxID=230812 RepID=A0A8H6XUL4_9AGAR|nr:hypothetical protein MSAN_01807900 [Mycena sanguinolenta]
MFSSVLRAFIFAVFALSVSAQTNIYSNVRLISDVQEPFVEYCLAAESDTDGAAAVVVPCSTPGSSDVNWSVPEPVNGVFPAGPIETTDGLLCITIPAGVVGSGIQLAVKTCTGEQDQQWQITGNAQWQVAGDPEAFCITIPGVDGYEPIPNPTVVELQPCAAIDTALSAAQNFAISFNS